MSRDKARRPAVLLLIPWLWCRFEVTGAAHAHANVANTAYGARCRDAAISVPSAFVLTPCRRLPLPRCSFSRPRFWNTCRGHSCCRVLALKVVQGSYSCTAREFLGVFPQRSRICVIV